MDVEMIPETKDLGRYLEDTIDIDWQTPEVCGKARELVDGTTEVSVRIERCFVFVRDEITLSSSPEVDVDVLTCRASEVLKEGTGLSYAKSHLLAALLRSIGLPAGFCYQRLRRAAPSRGFALHGFNAVYLSEDSRWVLLDAHGNSGDVRTELRLEGSPSLAYTADPDEGEMLLATIFKRPGKRILEVLGKAPSLEVAIKHLL